MKVKQLTQYNKKGSRYISGLLLMRGIRQDEIAEKLEVSKPLVSLVVTRQRGGSKKYGPKVVLIRQAIAAALDMSIDDLWPDKAA